MYEYCCVRCTSAYVGMTSRTLGSRIDEHRGVSHRTGQFLSHPSYSAVRNHANDCDVRIDHNSFKILTSAASPLDLKILESLHIKKSKPILNGQQASFPLEIVL